ncbi:MAG: SDR family oxidoreductase [Candidatus Dormibacteraeota bacterium]|nr:SDR family oxidoreductase [Candidatus Dormibacteraeota bacterium]
MFNELESRVVLITGASRGLGRELALALAGRGARLALCARGRRDLEATAAEARRDGADVLTIRADVSSESDRERLVSLTMDRFGRIDVLVNNASSLGPTPLPLLADTEPAALAEVVATNLEAPFRLTQEVLGPMLLRGSGLVLNISSDAAASGYPGWGAYSAAKAGLDALTRVWAAELEGTGVRVISVDPGDMDTDMHRAAVPDADPAELRSPTDVAAALLGLIEEPPATPRLELRLVEAGR